MLCAQGGCPDYSMTLWDWCKGTIIARTSSPFTHRIHFSNYNDNYMVSCGEAGLSFWQLTKTYTGTKLLQNRGHFNILDECQVLAAYIMPDGKVATTIKIFLLSLNTKYAMDKSNYGSIN
ncbi:cilia- and flagella-associated protein 44-like [Homalodisca vitripennis]|uniref:cilia- and flagella-associated protein 44-like n=1 Tax=Homalodisca vitripennis TaxID=197043 RepID=UPI001EEC17E5|nr:cilia- and flagella-associated protein 44-like [Homalodisca vitripennis]